MPSKLDFLLVAAVLAVTASWIEDGHSVLIDGPAEAAPLAKAATCFDNYGVNRMVFLDGGFASGSLRPAHQPTTPEGCTTK